MKKLLLLAAAALTVVACKKDSDDPTPPTPPTPPAPQTQTPTVSVAQSSIPSAVDFTYPKSLTIVTEDSRGVRTRTITYTVDPTKKLLTKVVFSNGGEYNLNYDANNFLTSIVRDAQKYSYSYNEKGQLTKLEFSGIETATYQYTHNAEGKVVSATYKAEVSGLPGQFDEHTFTYDYSTANKVVVTDKDHDPSYPVNTYTYTLSTSKNVSEFKGTDMGTYTYENYDSKLNLASKSPFTFFDFYGNFIPYADKNNLVYSANNPGKKTVRTQYNTLTYDYSYNYNGNVVAKSVEVQNGGLGGTTTITTTYNY